MHFFKAALPACKVAQAVADRDCIKCVVGKWQLLRITANEERCGRGGPGSGDAQHGETEIEADHCRAGVSQCEGDVAGAAAHIERAHSRSDAGKAHEFALPETMEAKTLEIVDEIVARRDI